MNNAPEPQSTPPLKPRRTGWRLWVIALVVVVAALLGMWRTALYRLESGVLRVLGPDADLQDVSLAWPGVVVIKQLNLKSPEGWPAKETLRAERVKIVPTLRSLFSDRMIVRRVKIDGGYLSVLRDKQSQLKLVPSIFDPAYRREPPKPYSERLHVTIEDVDLADSTIDFYDASVEEGKLVNLQLVDVAAELRGLRMPERDAHTKVDIKGLVKGEKNDDGERLDGPFTVKGQVQVATRESELAIKLDGVDMRLLEPYLLRRSETGVKRGKLSMELTSTVKDRHLDAPGTLVLEDLKLRPGENFGSTFMGMPRQAVLATLKDRDGKITLDFNLEGDLGNTRFSLNDTMAVRVAVGAAGALGIGLVDVIKGVGSFGGDTVEATGDAIGKLFGMGKSDDDVDKDEAKERDKDSTSKSP